MAKADEIKINALVAEGFTKDEAKELITFAKGGKRPDDTLIQKFMIAKTKRKNGTPYKYENPDGTLNTDIIAELTQNYIDGATDANSFSLPGLAIALDVDVSTIELWAKGLTAKPKIDNDGNDISVYNKELSRPIKRACTYILKWLVENSNSQRQSKDIFLLKNWFGMVDKQEQEINVTGSIKFTADKADMFN